MGPLHNHFNVELARAVIEERVRAAAPAAAASRYRRLPAGCRRPSRRRS